MRARSDVRACRLVPNGCASVAVVLLSALLATPAEANAGALMIELMAVPIWASLLAIIPLEALLARKWIGCRWNKAIIASAAANLASTVVGIPLTLVYVGPIGPLLPVVALVLLVPMYFVSVGVEYLVLGSIVRWESRARVSKWAWRANLVSYSLLALVPLSILVKLGVEHQLALRSEAYRPVESVSADRLWELALERGARRGLPMGARLGESDHPRSADEAWHPIEPAIIVGQAAETERFWLEALSTNDRAKPASAPDTGRTGSYEEALPVHSLARLYYSRSRLREAKPLFERLVRARDARIRAGEGARRFPAYPLELASILVASGDSGSAVGFLEHVLEREASVSPRPDQDLLQEVMVHLGDLCWQRRQLDQADSLYVRASRLPGASFWHGPPWSPTSPALGRVLALRRSRQQFQQAAHLLSEQIGEPRYDVWDLPDSSRFGDLFLTLGLLYLDQCQWPQAEHYLKSAIRWSELRGEAASAYSALLAARGERAGAARWKARADRVNRGHD